MMDSQLPVALLERLCQADKIDLVVDNATRPKQSETEAYYLRESYSSIPRLARTLSGTTFRSKHALPTSPKRRGKRKLQFSLKKPTSRFFNSQSRRRGIVPSLCAAERGTDTGDRWNSRPSPAHCPAPVPVTAASGGISPSVPVRRASVENDKLKAPTRRTSLTQLIRRRRSSLERNEAKNSGKPLNLPVRRTSDARRRSSTEVVAGSSGGGGGRRRSTDTMTTSQLISSAIDELKLYDSDNEDKNEDQPTDEETIDSEMDLKTFLASRNAVVHAFRIKAA